MLTITVENGRNYVPALELHTSAINDVLRNSFFEDFQRQKKVYDQLGQFAPLLVCDDGEILGGNHGYKAMMSLQDPRFDKMWICLLTFKQLEDGTWQAVVDGIPQKKNAKTIEQIKKEYMLADNDSFAHWDRDALIADLQPYKDDIPLEQYKANLGYATDMSLIMENYSGGEEGQEEETQKKAEDIKTISARYTPDQFVEIEPIVQMARDDLGVKNNTDLFTRLLQIWQESSGMKMKDNPEGVDGESLEVPDPDPTHNANNV